MVQAFAPHAADQAFHIRILPRAPWRRDDLFHAHPPSRSSGTIARIAPSRSRIRYRARRAPTGMPLGSAVRPTPSSGSP